MTTPLVSVIVPVYNGEQRLRAALDSIFAQDYPALEVFVVDDGSRDGSEAIARSFPRVNYIYQPNSGVAVARNSALARARGEYVAFLDQDDRWAPTKTSRQVEYLQVHPDVWILYSYMENILEGDRPDWLPDSHVGQPMLGFLPGSVLVRAEAFRRIGVFNPSNIVGSDVDWFFRLNDAGYRRADLQEILLWRHVHDANESQRTDHSRRELLDLLAASARRRRKMAAS